MRYYVKDLLFRTFLFFMVILLLPFSSVHAQTTKTFTPTALSDTQTLVSPFRGFFRWRGEEEAPQPYPSYDAYERYEWRTLEPSRGVYDFSRIVTDYNIAVSQGRKFSFRVRAMVGENNGNQVFVPEYLRQYGWYYDSNNNGSTDTYVPDFNHPFFLERADLLLAALGNRFNNEPHIGWVEIGMLGQFGEWVVHANYSEAPDGIDDITDDTRRRVIDMYVNHFPNRQLITSTFTYGNVNALEYAFTHPRVTSPIGWRTDCLGRVGYFSQWTNHPSAFARVSEQWKVALVVGEFCPITAGETQDTFAEAVRQVRTYHFSLVGNGNTDPYTAFNLTDQAMFQEVGRSAGYRIKLASLSLPDNLPTGQSFQISSTWNNTGAAPVYERWSIEYRLVHPTNGSVVWQANSAYNLQSLMPASSGVIPTRFVDTFTLPGSIPGGEYSFAVKIYDPQVIRQPLQLAIEGRSSTGVYYLGRVNVGITQGDADGDGDVDGSDFTRWLQYYGQSVLNGPANGDFNNNRMVDGLDFTIWLNGYVRLQI